MEDLKEYNHSAYEAISNLIEVDKYHDFNTRIPFYEEIILERGDAAAIAWISDRLDKICNDSSAIIAYVNIHGFYKNKHTNVDLNGGICEILHQVCRYYSETHGGKIVFNYKKKEE